MRVENMHYTEKGPTGKAGKPMKTVKKLPVRGLLESLIRIPSLSRQERKVSVALCEHLASHGLEPKTYRNNVWVEIGEGKKPLLFVSHLDTVPASNEWETDPFSPIEKDGRLYGLGACDAKGSVASMAAAALMLAKGGKLKGKVIFAAVCGEEIGGVGIRQLMKLIPKPMGVVVGEPTNLNIAIGMRGRTVVKMITTG
ncbi:M20/M25/M40 family metallo-hydrolase, partial [Candidatus Micrarchaeota archaeon]|nr:M20/M25/M40 family metallo-hydrolase [Candidatus Micrarchaeota archaeon]